MTEQKSIDLDVGGPNAVEKAKAMLSGYDIDGDDVTKISIQVFEDTDDADTASDDSSSSSNTGDAPNRELRDIPANSTLHLVLATVDALDYDRVDTFQLADALGVDRNHTSSVLSKLYQRRMLDRDDDQRTYKYWLTDYGRAALDEIGRDVTPEDVGGVWTDD